MNYFLPITSQELQSLSKYLGGFVLPDKFLNMASNFHFLLFLYTNHFVEFHEEDLKKLANAVQKKDAEAAKQWAEQNPTWGTLALIWLAF